MTEYVYDKVKGTKCKFAKQQRVYIEPEEMKKVEKARDDLVKVLTQANGHNRLTGTIASGINELQDAMRLGCEHPLPEPPRKVHAPFEPCRMKFVLEHPQSGGHVADKTFGSEKEAMDWWERNSGTYPEDMQVNVKEIEVCEVQK